MTYEITVNQVKNPKGNICGFASVVFEDCFKAGNIAIVKNKEGELFVSMPRYESSKEQDEYQDICHPITKEFRESLCDNILKSFAELERTGEKNYHFGEAQTKELAFNVAVTPYEREGSSLRGLARIYLEDRFVINQVTLVEGRNGIFVSMPSYKTNRVDQHGKPVYRDICYPVTAKFRENLYDRIQSAYEEAKTKRQEQSERKQETDEPQHGEAVPETPFR